MAARMLSVLEAGKCPPGWAMRHVVAQDDWGDLYLVCNQPDHRHRPPSADEPWWCRSYNRRDPRHWRYMALTLLTGWVMFVESS